MTIERVGVIGCGLMGSGIAEVCAASGAEVVVVETSPDALGAGRIRIERSTARGEQAGKRPEGYAVSVLDHLAFSTSLDDLADCELLIEAIVEDPQPKLELFRKLDAIVEGSTAILASNTSSIPITQLAAVTTRPERVIGMHFFNPVPVLNLVELIRALETGDATLATAETFATEQLGKVVVHAPDRAGFVVNALLVPYLLAAIRMLESGAATAQDIDRGMVEGCAHPMGPLALVDLIGLDTTKAVAESLYDEFKEQQYAPPPLLARMVEAGRLGRKSGRGFYDYAGGTA